MPPKRKDQMAAPKPPSKKPFAGYRLGEDQPSSKVYGTTRVIKFAKKSPVVEDEGPAKAEPYDEKAVIEKLAEKSEQTIELSREQAAAVHDVLERKNTLVIAKAGSGKTSLTLAAAELFYKRYNQRTLIITYNARLKDETRAKIKRRNMDGMAESHSYHAAASKFFIPRKEGGSADNALIHAATQTEKPIVALDFGLYVIDEAQDMSPLYADFIKHMLKHNSRKPVMLMVGDPFQRLFAFNAATCDFMMYPRKNFGELCHEDAFTTHHLSICWRITHEMARFINAHMNPCNLKHSVSPEWWKENGDKIAAWWGKGIRANPKRGPAPDSVKIVRGWGSREIVQETQRMFDQFGNDEVALLAFSLKGEKTPIRAIVDRMGKHSNENWAILAGSSNSSEDVLSGKRLASTVHRMKGLERKGIVVCGLDSFIEKLYVNDPLEHFNVWYVACTRAKERLIINSTGVDYATIRCSRLEDTDKAKQICEVPALTSYVPFDSILSVPENLFNARVEFQFVEKRLALDRQACLVEGRAAGTVEDLSPFMSRAISFKLMILIHGKLFRIPVDEDNKSYDRDMIDFIHQFYEQVETNPESITWPALVKYSVGYETLKSKYKHLWRQLTDYEAFTPSALLEKCTINAFNLLWALAIKDKLVAPGGFPNGQPDEKTEFDQTTSRAAQLKTFVDFQVPVAIPFYPPWFLQTYVGQISGVADIVFNGSTVIGIECSDSIPAERGLELSIYSAIRHLLQPDQKTRTIMILTNTAQLVSVELKLKPISEQVPVQYELIHRCARRKLQLPAANNDDLLKDFTGKQDKKGGGARPGWLKLFD